MIVFPNAKINIGLNITEKRADGYHNIETLFYPLQLNDILEIIPDNEASTMELSLKGIVLEHNAGENLVEKAWQILHQKYGIGGCKAILHKVIPHGAGLGGGSADAAFALKALNELFELQLTPKTLKELAAQIGADCPFFIENRPSMATGIGDVLCPSGVSLKGFYLVLVKPHFSVPTKDAYAGIVPQTPATSLAGINSMGIENWQGIVKNDFEPSVFKKYPEVASIKQKLIDMGASYASMSGSGSSVFGIFKNKPNTENWFDTSHFVWQEKLLH